MAKWGEINCPVKKVQRELNVTDAEAIEAIKEWANNRDFEKRITDVFGKDN